MPLYIICNNLNQANKLNRHLYRLTRPDSVRDPNDITLYHGRLVSHPTENKLAIELDDNNQFINPLTPDTTLDELSDDLDNAPLKGAIAARIRQNRGKNIPLKDLFPPGLLNKLKTPAEMRSDGWLLD